MKKIIFIFVLALGLVTLTACGSSYQSGSSDQAAAPSESATPEAGNAQPAPAAAAALMDGAYNVDTAGSRVSWEAAKITATHTGLVAVKSGSLQVTGGALSGGSFVLDMPSISSDENLEGLVKHLKSPDFFDVTAYPEAKLVLSSVQPGPVSGEYVLSGDLTIKEVTAPVSFAAKVVDMNGVLEAKASFSIDRTKWGIKYLSGNFVKDLGDKAIDDTIKFNVDLRAVK